MRPSASAVEVEQPVVEVAAEAVQEHDRLAALALAQARAAWPAADRRRSRAAGPPSSSASPGTNVAWNSATKASMSASRHLGAAITPSRPPTGIDVALAGRRGGAARRRRALDGAGDLLGLDLGDLVADGDLGALLDQPARRAALLHRQAPLGHARACCDRRALTSRPRTLAAGDLAHRVRRSSRRRDVDVLERRARTAPACAARSPCWIGAFERAEGLLATSAEMSAAMLQRGCASSTHDQPAGVLDALEDRLRRRAARSCAGRRPRSRCPPCASSSAASLASVHHAAEGDDRHVVALAHDVGLAERDRVGLLRHLALDRRTAPCARRR